MPDKEQATKLLGFRDDEGKLVCPADVVDSSKSYTCHLGAEDGSYSPSEADLQTIGELLKAVGLSGAVTRERGKGGTTFKNKAGVVICRLVEGAPEPPKKQAPPPPPPPAPEPEPAPPEPTPEPAPKAEEAISEVPTQPDSVSARSSAKVETQKAEKKAEAKKPPRKKTKVRRKQ